MSHGHSYRSVQVAGDAPYTITIGPGLLEATTENAARLAHVLRGRHALVVSDSHVAPLYADRVEALLVAAKPQLTIARWVMPAGEQEKTLARFCQCLDALAALGATRDAAVVALGGGVVGDLAGFVAATFLRGVNYVQIPTTLLAQIDSSVGGKTAVNHKLGKNLIGAFHQPRAVVIDPGVLRGLPARELRAGLYEAVKYGVIRDAELFSLIEGNLDGINALDPALLSRVIARSCEMSCCPL